MIEETDQKYRKPEILNNIKDAARDSIWALQKKLDLINQKKIKNYIKRNGWPQEKKKGSYISKVAWLVVQHADNDLEFQKNVLNLFTIKLNININLKNYAYLNDRVLINSGKKQLFGTQFKPTYKDKKIIGLEPKPILNPEFVEYRRKYVGLMSLSKYLSFAKKRYVTK